MGFGLDKHDVSAIKRTALRNLLTKQHSMGGRVLSRCDDTGEYR